MPNRGARWGLRWLRPTGAGLITAVLVWWLVIGGIVALMLPARAASAPPAVWHLAPAELARIHQPGLPRWPVPVERAAFEMYYRGVRESDDAAIDAAFETSEWIEASHGQAVRIVAAEGEAVQIELLEGPYAGCRAWVKPRHLGPMN